MLTGNKGEWSEIYVLLKLLGDQTIHAGDGNLNRLADLFYPVLNVLRIENGNTHSYQINEDTTVNIEWGNENTITVAAADFLAMAKTLLIEIKANKKTFAVPTVEEFLNSIQCYSLKAKSTSKTDITVKIHDLRTGMTPVLGFSIKSKLGSPSTLLNAGETTNFIYEILDSNLDENAIQIINALETKNKIKDRITAILASGGKLSFTTTQKNIFQNNLVLVDSLLPKILAELLLLSNRLNTTDLGILCTALEDQNPIGFDRSTKHSYYKYKIKRFLVDVALGLMPGQVWDGIYDANGGYLVVKEDGDVLCYHIYNRNEFEDYLLHNTKLETASSTRHYFGKIYMENGRFYFRLNLQVRFK